MADKRLPIDTSYGSENNAIDCAFKIVEESHPPKARNGRRVTVAAAKDIPVGGRRIVNVGPFSIGVFNVDGTFYALRNTCPHQGAPLCQGSIHGTHRPSPVHEYDPAFSGRIIRCPWHGWEFDIVTGKGLYDATSRVATYPVEVTSDGDVVVTV